MKIISSVLLIAALSATVYAKEKPGLSTELDKFSYALGLQIAKGLKDQGLSDINASALALAVEDVVKGRNPRLSAEEMQAAISAYQQELMQARILRAKKNKEAEKAFLAKNKAKAGVTEIGSGLQYKVIKKGDGEKPKKTDSVIVHYRGRLLDGTEFDSSYKRGEPAELKIAGVIPGWQQALQLMPVGSQWQVWVPSDLGYGLRGAGNTIGPNETLFFDIELIDIKQKK